VKRKAHEYIVFPLDVATFDEAMHFVRVLRDSVGLFKVGLELFISLGPDIVKAVHETAGRKVFLDLKLHDIPETMRRAFLAASSTGARFVTVHCDQGGGMLKEAAEASPGTKILGISVLTSLGTRDLTRMGYVDTLAEDIGSMVLRRARIALEAGCHGVVCSGREVARLRRELGMDALTVTPGIRPAWTLVPGDDQKRVVTPEKAVSDGADYIVIGRPIRDAQDPAAAAARVAEEISLAL